MANFTDPVKAAFGRYLQGFHKMLIADTPALREYAARPFAKAAVWAPGRMVDQVEEMIASWRKNDTSREARATPFLPVIIAACSKDYMPAQPDYTRQAADPVDVMIPGDPKNRVFKMRVAISEIRIQIAIVAAEEPTARSLAMQLQMYCSAMERRRFFSEYPLAGVRTNWPVSLEMPELSAVPVPTDQKNLTIMTVDFNGRASVPLLMYPRTAAPDSDGRGSNDYDDPNGYLVVTQADIFGYSSHYADPDVNIEQAGDMQA